MQAEDVKKVAIAGAGVMGASMAQIFAKCGYEVALYDISQEALDRGRHLIELNQATQVETGDITTEDSAALTRRISFAAPNDMSCFATADLLVECIVENLDVKHAFWKAVSAAAKPDALLATNTSGLSITKIGEAVEGPERFCGMHWFNPPHIIPLIEVIHGERTSDATADAVYRISELIGKKPIHVSKDAPGFIANRLQLAILREAIYMKEQGIGDFDDIDRCMKYGLGFRYACLGPFEVCDHGGLDTFYHIASYLWEDLSDAKTPDGTVLGDLFEKGDYGVKSGAGFYDYSGDRADEAVRERDAMYLAMAKANPTAIAEKDA